MGGAFDLYSDLLDGRDGRRVLHEAPGPAALEQLGVTADAFTGLRLQAQDRALTDDGTQRPEPPLELLESLSFGQLPLADELAQRLPLGRVEAEGVDGEGAQQTDHGGGEPQAGGRSEFVDPGDGGIAAGFAAIDVEEAQCGQAQGHRHRIGVDNTQLPLFLGEFLARILRDEVVTAGEGGVEVASAVALHELGQDPDDAAGNIGGISDPLQGFHDVPLSGVRVVQPEGGDLSGRVEEAEQPLGIGHAAATPPLPQSHTPSRKEWRATERQISRRHSRGLICIPHAPHTDPSPKKGNSQPFRRPQATIIPVYPSRKSSGVPSR